MRGGKYGFCVYYQRIKHQMLGNTRPGPAASLWQTNNFAKDILVLATLSEQQLH